MASVPLRIRIRSLVAGAVRRHMIAAKDRFLESARTSCRSTQHATLARLLKLNADSRFSVERGLRADLSVAGFRERCDIADYEVFRPYVTQMQTGDHQALLGSGNRLLMFAITSGTTAQAKLIPVTRAFVDDYRRGWQHWGMGTFQDHAALSLRRIVQISSTHNRWQTPDGTPCGNISGLATSMQKTLVRKLYSIPSAVMHIADPAVKRQIVATFALADPWLGMFITANPSTLLQMMTSAADAADEILRDIHDGTLKCLKDSDVAHRLLSHSLKASPERACELETHLQRDGHFDPVQCWPGLTCLGVWSGGSAAAYLPQLQKLFGNLPIRDHGLHASEGRMTIPFADNSPAGILDIQSHFFEFIPSSQGESDNPDVLEAHELQRDADYYILLTTSSGLYRYNICDVVRCVGFFGTTPMLEFLHKGDHISSITGEKITESQVVAAVRAASESVGMSLQQFTVTPVWGQPPAYRMYVDVSSSVTPDDDQLNRLADATDRELNHLNCEYEDKRSTARLGALQCEVLPRSAWQTYASARLAASGGSPEQYKHACLVPDSRFENRFLAMTQKAAESGGRP